MKVSITLDFADALGSEYNYLLQETVNNYLNGFESEASVRTYKSRILNFLKFFSEDPSQEPLRVYVCQLYNQESLPSETEILFFSLAADYRHFIQQNQSVGNRTRDNIAAGIRGFIQACEQMAIMPRGTAKMMKGFKYDKKVVGEGHTFLDVKLHESLNSSEVEKILKQINADGEYSEEDQRAILKLVKNINQEHVGKITCLESMIELSTMTLKSRIDSLRQSSINVIDNWSSLIEQAEKWEKDSSLILKAQQFQVVLSDKDMHAKVRCAEYTRLFESNSTGLSYVYYKKVLKSYYTDNGRIYSVMNRYCTDMVLLRKLLNGSPELLLAVFVLLLIDTTANVESIRKLKLSDFRNDGEAPEIVWFKGRDNRFHRKILDRKNVSDRQLIDAIELLIKSLEFVRSQSNNIDKDNLFIQRYKNNVTKHDSDNGATTPADTTFNRWFTEECLKVSNGSWSATPKTIRGSLLLLTALVTKDSFQVKERGGWVGNSSMSEKYTRHFAEILRRDNNIREFLSWYETLTTINIENFAEKIGIDPVAYEARKKSLLNQQFGGIHCTDPTAGIQPGTVKGKVCYRVDKCITCSNRRNFFLVTKENLASVLMLHDALERLLQSNIEDEKQKWSVWHYFTSSMINKFTNASEHRRLVIQAKELVAKTENPYLKLIIPINSEVF
jgi:hypothetical protein